MRFIKLKISRLRRYTIEPYKTKGSAERADIDYITGLTMSEEWGRARKQPLHPYLQNVKGENEEIEALIALSQQAS